jgi:GNAT superfamily N-acetyltransferase
VAVVAGDRIGLRLGAAWTFHHEPPLLSTLTTLPEIAIAVTPGRRGSGVGGSLLEELFVRCSDRYIALSLNVHQRNPATRLYERKGFRVLGQGRGTLGIAMRKELRRLEVSNTSSLRLTPWFCAP